MTSPILPTNRIFAKHPQRAHIAILIAARELQSGNLIEAKKLLHLAENWGAERSLAVRILIASAHNTLGRVATLDKQPDRALQHFESAAAIGMIKNATRRLKKAQVKNQFGQACLQLIPKPHWHLQSKDGPVLAKLFRRLDHLCTSFSQADALPSKLEQTEDPFLPGKLALGLAWWIMERGATGTTTAQRCARFAALEDQLYCRPVESWGIYFYLKALLMLQQADLLDACVTAEQLAVLKERLDWRGFVDESDFSLIHKPSNFYGVAFAISALRLKLGWDSNGASEQLLQKIVEHYQKHSGRFGFADDTDGHGCYDRYSFLLIAELAHHMRDANLPLTTEMRGWLERSVKFVLINLNAEGDGFIYGRSIGAYGDSAFMEILAAAAVHGLLSPTDASAAHTFCVLATQKFLAFWWDKERQRVNLWHCGRATDAYRGPDRALGETFSLLHQHIYVHSLWQALGFTRPLENKDFCSWLEQRPRHVLTRFAEGEHSYAVLTVRDGHRRFNLPLVNGHKHHAHAPYHPIPFSPRLIQGTPGQSNAQLTPKIRLPNGTVLMPLTWFHDIALHEDQDGIRLTWEQRAMDDISHPFPQKNDSFSIRTSYVFAPGRITRSDILVPRQPIDVSSIEMEFACFSSSPQHFGTTVRFSTGDIHIVETQGFKTVDAEPLAADQRYRSPEGPMSSLVRMHLATRRIAQPLELRMSIGYHHQHPFNTENILNPTRCP